MKKSRLMAVVYACTMSLCFSAAQSSAATVFSDDTFANAEWGASIISQTAQTPSFTATQITTGGNPGAYRKVQHTYGGLVNNGSIIVGQLKDGATYDPSVEGAISTIDFSFDVILFDGGDSNAVGYGGLIFQNGSYYRGGYTLTSIEPLTDVWEGKIIEDLLASDFVLVMGAGPAQPDFSSSGNTIQLGYYSSNGTAGSQRTTTLSGLDNWSASIDQVSVPIPPVLYLLGSGLLSLMGISKLKR